jgi:hypothetical protein
MAISHKYTLMCDDVRREDNGKLLLIGVYQDTILVPQFPTMMGLTFFASLESDRPGTWSMRMRVERMETGNRLVEGMGAITFPRPGIGANPVKIPNIQFQESGSYQFVMEIEQHPPIIYTFTVGLNIQQAPGAVGGVINR